MAERLPRHWGLTRTEWLLGLSVLLVVGLLVHPYRAQQASRYLLTAAIVERGTLTLDDYEAVLGRDRAVRSEHIYSDKAPGQPLLAVPFYAMGRLAGIEDATRSRVEDNLGVWWLTLWSAGVPGAALAVMMYRRASIFQLRGALLGAIGAFGGTVLLPLSAILFGHVLAASLLYGGYLLLMDGRKPVRLAVAGSLAGLAVMVDYTAILGVGVLGLYAVWQHGTRSLVWVGGGVPIALGLALYNQLAFGDPLTLSYQYTAFNEVTETSRPMFEMFDSTRLSNTLRILFDGRGLLLATPVIPLALAGAGARLRRGFQQDALMALAMFSVFIWIPVLWGNPWGGASPGLRYLAPALPFLAVPIAWAWSRWPRVTVFLTSVSVMTMLLATITEPLLARDSRNGLNTWLDWFLSGDLAPTVLTRAIGDIGWLVNAGLVLVAVVLLVQAHRQRLETVELR